MLDLQRLRALHAVARHGSISAAADALYLTASAVSQQIGKLEREVGQQLLRRQGRGVRLTDAGRLLTEHSDRILSAVERAEADLEARRDEVAGRLTIAAFATAAREIVPPAIRQLHGDHPALEIESREMEPDQALPLVRRGNLDVAIVDAWSNDPLAMPDDLVREHLLDDQADLALPAVHPMAARRAVDLVELEDQAWISWPRGSICHDWLIHTFRSLDLEPRVAHTAMEHATQLAMVASGLGAAVMPRLGRGPVPEGVVIVEVRPALTRQVSAVWRRDAGRRPAIGATVAALRAHAPTAR